MYVISKIADGYIIYGIAISLSNKHFKEICKLKIDLLKFHEKKNYVCKQVNDTDRKYLSSVYGKIISKYIHKTLFIKTLAVFVMTRFLIVKCSGSRVDFYGVFFHCS